MIAGFQTICIQLMKGTYNEQNILMGMFLALIAVAPAGAADMSKGASQTGMVAASDSWNEAVDCFYEQNRFLPECKKK